MMVWTTAIGELLYAARDRAVPALADVQGWGLARAVLGRLAVEGIGLEEFVRVAEAEIDTTPELDIYVLVSLVRDGSAQSEEFARATERLRSRESYRSWLAAMEEMDSQ